MALKRLQSAVYPPAEPKLQTGLTEAELDTDYRRLERFLRTPGPTPEAWPRWPVPRPWEDTYGQTKARQRRPI
jgi:hypothetical protein